MTRLREEWIEDIKLNLDDYEDDLFNKTGCTLLKLATLSAGIEESIIEDAIKEYKVAVVPITTGQGIIGSFTASVAAIINRLGFRTFVTDKSDVDGIFEAYEEDVSCIFLADDNRFIGINRKNNLFIDNNIATAKGYITALEQSCENLQDKEVLILGYGTVGRIMLSILKEKGAIPKIHDKNHSILTGQDKHTILKKAEQIRDYPFILDATNEGGWLNEDMLHKNFVLAAPGIPLSLERDLFEKYKGRVIHDPLQIGVAVMMAELCL